MGFDRYQQGVVDIARHLYPDDGPDRLVAQLAEEVGELSRAVRRFGAVRPEHPGELPGTKHELTDELGDVLFVLARIADKHSIPLSDVALQAVWKMGGRAERADSRATG